MWVCLCAVIGTLVLSFLINGLILPTVLVDSNKNMTHYQMAELAEVEVFGHFVHVNPDSVVIVDNYAPLDLDYTVYVIEGNTFIYVNN